MMESQMVKDELDALIDNPSDLESALDVLGRYIVPPGKKRPSIGISRLKKYFRNKREYEVCRVDIRRLSENWRRLFFQTTEEERTLCMRLADTLQCAECVEFNGVFSSCAPFNEDSAECHNKQHMLLNLGGVSNARFTEA